MKTKMIKEKLFEVAKDIYNIDITHFNTGSTNILVAKATSRFSKSTIYHSSLKNLYIDVNIPTVELEVTNLTTINDMLDQIIERLYEANKTTINQSISIEERLGVIPFIKKLRFKL